MRQVNCHALLDAEDHKLDQVPAVIKRHNRALTQQSIKVLGFPGLFGLFLHESGGVGKILWLEMAEPDVAIGHFMRCQT